MLKDRSIILQKYQAKMLIHEVVRRIREDRGLSQSNLADALGVDITTVNRWEKKGGIKTEWLSKIAEVFKMPVSDMFTYGEHPLLLNNPIGAHKHQHKINIVVNLDGTVETLNEWIETLRKLNEAIA